MHHDHGITAGEPIELFSVSSKWMDGNDSVGPSPRALWSSVAQDLYTERQSLAVERRLGPAPHKAQHRNEGSDGLRAVADNVHVVPLTPRPVNCRRKLLDLPRALSSKRVAQK